MSRRCQALPRVEVEADPRMAAFLAPGCLEVFHSVATPREIWKADPYDVETIHAEARAAFEHLLNRASQVPSPPSGAVLVLLGEAGSGKTHLMRAFRTRAHGQGLGYCGYLQMTSEASIYARYMLTNLIERTGAAVRPHGPSRTGLARLSAAILESVPPRSSGIEMEAFRSGDFDGDPTRLTDEYADRLQAALRFSGLRPRAAPRDAASSNGSSRKVRSRAADVGCGARKCDPRTALLDRRGHPPARTTPTRCGRCSSSRMPLTDAVHGVLLVLLIDQLEDMANQSAPAERFLKVVDAITTFTDTIPNTVVVLACLEDYFKTNVEKLNRAKHDRLMRDPEPIRLLGNRTLDEIREMASRRLSDLYYTANVDIDSDDELYPFRDIHLAGLNNLRTRDALDFLRRHHQRCITAGRWLSPEAHEHQAQPPGGNGLPAAPLPIWTRSGTIFIPPSRRPCLTVKKS